MLWFFYLTFIGAEKFYEMTTKNSAIRKPVLLRNLLHRTSIS